MTRQRNFGDNKPFEQWSRDHPQLHSIKRSHTVFDQDIMVHKYQADVDSIGTRQVQLLMNIEVKTRGCRPVFPQLETIFFHHQLLQRKTRLLTLRGFKVSVWCFGYFGLSLGGTTPLDGSIEWGRFTDKGEMFWVDVPDEQGLVDILSFKLDPMTLKPLELRRHHKNNTLTRIVKTELGFLTEETIKRSS